QHPGSLAERGVRHHPARPRAAAGCDRPEPAECQRLLAGGGPPVRRDRRADRRLAGQDAVREGVRLPWPDLDLRCRRPGRRRDPGGCVMTTILEVLTGNPVAKAVGKQLGVPQATELRRGRVRPTHPVVLAVLGGSDQPDRAVTQALQALGVPTIEAVRDEPATRTTDADGRSQPPAYQEPIGAVVLDASALTTVAELEGVRAVL